MSWNLIALDGVAATPWRNGGGVTRELLAWPDAADWRLRISVADVERDGPFSRFDGIERWFAVLEGAGVALEMAGGVHVLSPASDPLRFDGSLPVACRLVDGRTRDFNLMARPGTAQLQRVRGVAACRATAPTIVAAYSHAPGAHVVAGADAQTLRPRHLAWRTLDAGESASLRADDGLWAEVRR